MECCYLLLLLVMFCDVFGQIVLDELLCLGQVINSLVDREKGKQNHVPFRDSKLTFLLRDSWGGNSKTCLVATVSPSLASLSETIPTLKFAQRAKLIKNNAVLNENTCGSVAALQAEVARLKSKLKARNSVATNSDDSTLSAVTSPIVPRKLPGFRTPARHSTISSLRNQNSVLSQKVKFNEEQVKSLKRKFHQENTSNQFKERRMNSLLSIKKTRFVCETDSTIQNTATKSTVDAQKTKVDESIALVQMELAAEKEKTARLQESLDCATQEVSAANTKAEVLQNKVDELRDWQEGTTETLRSEKIQTDEDLEEATDQTLALSEEVEALKLERDAMRRALDTKTCAAH